jgi:GNAT superfamily N-acetyltransferase
VLNLANVAALPLAGGYALTEGGVADMELMLTLTALPKAHAKERFADGSQLWFVMRDREPAFSCWIFRRVAPMRAAANRRLELPPGVACLEDSVTRPEHRGHGIARAAWTQIAEGLAADGFHTLITKCEVDNAPAKAAVEKAGFRPAALMTLRHRGLRDHVTVNPAVPALDPAALEIEAELARRLSRG